MGTNSGQNESFERFRHGRKIGDRSVIGRRAWVETWLFKKGKNLGPFEDRRKNASAEREVCEFRENWR